MSSDTPRTDAAWEAWCWKPSGDTTPSTSWELARQFERENRELAAALAMMLSYVDERDFDGAPSDYAVSIARAALAKVQP